METKYAARSSATLVSLDDAAVSSASRHNRSDLERPSDSSYFWLSY